LSNPQNWRVHPKFQQDALSAVLDEVGFVARVIVNQTTGHVVDGHLRVSLAISRGEPSVPVSYVRLSPDEERLVLATYDPLSSLALADADLLGGLVTDVAPFVTSDALSRLLVEMQKQAVTGLDDLDSLVPAPGNPEEGEEPGAPEPGLDELGAGELDARHQPLLDATPDELEGLRSRWGVQTGQTWEIPSGRTPGRSHLLLVGDALTVSPPEGIVLAVTSPPYGTEQSYEAQGKGQRGGEQWEALLYAFFQRWARCVPALAVNLADVIVSETPGREKHTYGTLVGAAQAAQTPLTATRIWQKDPTWAGTYPYWLNSYKPVHEWEYLGFFASDRYPFKKVAERVPDSESWRFRGVWQIKSVRRQNEQRGDHPAAFPVELPRRCLLLWSDAGATVADPFVGSGTTMVAAESLGRLCVGVERDPRFAALALERLTKLGLSPRKAKEA
jgi:DNA modification methylase